MAKEPENFQNNILSEDDIRSLIKSPVDKRLDVTKKIAEYYSAGGFDQQQMDIAEKIFRALLKDTEVEIRKTLSEAIKSSNDIPHDVVIELAKDISEVSIPVLEFSDVLTDIDLIDIINTTEDISKQEGITHRKSLPENVAGALVETGNESVVDSLLHNDNVEVSEKIFEKIVEDFSDKDAVMEAMIEREKLPVTVVENLAKTVSDEIYKKLSEKHKETFNKISEEVKKSRDVATMKVIGMKSTEQDYYNFCQMMKKLHISDDIIPISALCVGNINLFEVCMARITKVPVLNVRTLVFDRSNKGFKVLYDRAGLPSNLYEASLALIEVLRDVKDDLSNVGINLSKHNASKILTTLVMHSEEKGDIENIDYIITLIRHHAGMDRSS